MYHSCIRKYGNSFSRIGFNYFNNINKINNNYSSLLKFQIQNNQIMNLIQSRFYASIIASKKLPQLTLLSNPSSTSSKRVRAALHYLEISYQYVNIDIVKGLENNSEYFKSVNPSNQVPVLLLGDVKVAFDTLMEDAKQNYEQQLGIKEHVTKISKNELIIYKELILSTARISQSHAIIQYLNDLSPNNKSLFPSATTSTNGNDKQIGYDENSAAYTKAIIIDFLETINAYMQPMQNMPVTKQIKKMMEHYVSTYYVQYLSNSNHPSNKQIFEWIDKEWTQMHWENGLKKLDWMIQQYSGSKIYMNNISNENNNSQTYSIENYCIGDKLSIADIFFFPQVERIINRSQINMDKYPNVMRVYNHLKNLPCFSEI